MRPFLLLATRSDDAAADDEYAAVARFGGLEPHQLHRVRLEAGPMPELDLDDYSGVVVGGSPFTTSDPDDAKSPTQHRVERDLARLLDEVVARDFPFLGACYGVGTLGVRTGGVVDRTYGEPVGTAEVTLTEEGRADPVMAGLPSPFLAFVGHKEAIRTPPPGAVVLARSAACPVQAFRVRQNLYATQFHPEADVDAMVTRIRIYQDAGYFPPEEVDDLIARVSAAVVDAPPKVLANFVARYAR